MVRNFKLRRNLSCILYSLLPLYFFWILPSEKNNSRNVHWFHAKCFQLNKRTILICWYQAFIFSFDFYNQSLQFFSSVTGNFHSPSFSFKIKGTAITILVEFLGWSDFIPATAETWKKGSVARLDAWTSRGGKKRGSAALISLLKMGKGNHSAEAGTKKNPKLMSSYN